MLPEIGATELMVIAAVALIVVGPKDLPMLLRKLGQFVARLRGMASEFRTSFDDMARQSELDDLRKEVAAMRESATAETGEVNSALADMNRNIHDDMTLAETQQSLDEHAYDPNYQLYGEEEKPLTPADVAPKKPRAPRAKTTITKVEAPAAKPVKKSATAAPVKKVAAAPAKKAASATAKTPAKPRAPRKTVT